MNSISDTAIHTLIQESGISPDNHFAVAMQVRELLESSSSSGRKLAYEWVAQVQQMLRFRGAAMISPDYVGVHQLRVGKMIIFSQHLLSVSFPEFNFRRGDFIGRHHDVPEGISPLGDIPTNLKKALSPESCKLLDTIERKCIEILSEHLLCSEYYEEPETVHGLLTEALEKTTLESQVMKWFDLVDAYMVTMREIERGNGAEFFPIYERYLRIMRNIAQAQQYPEITHILSSLKFPEWESYHESLFDEEFEEWDLFTRFSASRHLFDIEELTKDIRISDHSLRFPEGYRAWAKYIDGEIY